jgi:hypothetical protein
MSNKQPRASFMSDADKKAMGNLPRTHQNCFGKTGKNRPGKTAQERARKGH